MINGFKTGKRLFGKTLWKAGLILLLVPLLLWAADDVKVKLTDSAGVSEFAVQDSTGASVFRVNSDGAVTLGAWQGTAIAIAKGGTGQSTATAAFDALSPTTTKGDIIVDNGTNNTRVAVGVNGQHLEADSAQAAGVKWSYTTLYNQSVAQQGAGFAADTYLTGSSIGIPSGSLKVGTRYHLVFDVSKTAAGTATPIIYVRFGTNGSTADAARLTFTFLAQTAAADIGRFDVYVTFRTVGAGTAVMQGSAQCNHRLSTTGLQNQPGTTLQVTSGAFDSTVANSIIGVSVNGGASAAWTVQLVQAELENLN